MKTSSAKAKGRRCAQEVKDLVLKVFSFLQDGDFQVTPSGVTGEDIVISPYGRKFVPLAVECKNQEALNVWAALKQAQYHGTKTGMTPALFFKRNHSDLYIALRAEDFLKILHDSKSNDRPASGT